MALKTKGNFVRISELIWSCEQIRELPDSAALRYIYLIAFSKANCLDGKVTALGVTLCGGTAKDIKALVDSGLLRPLETGGYEIIKFREWQATTDDVAVLADSGKVGTSKRWVKPDRGSRVTVDPNFNAAEGFATVYPEWPEPDRKFFNENRKENAEAFREAVGSATDMDAFMAALDCRLREYKRQVGFDRRKWLGTFKTFCAKWQDWLPEDYRGPKEPAAVVPETPAAPQAEAAPAPTPAAETPPKWKDPFALPGATTNG